MKIHPDAHLLVEADFEANDFQMRLKERVTSSVRYPFLWPRKRHRIVYLGTVGCGTFDFSPQLVGGAYSTTLIRGSFHMHNGRLRISVRFSEWWGSLVTDIVIALVAIMFLIVGYRELSANWVIGGLVIGCAPVLSFIRKGRVFQADVAKLLTVLREAAGDCRVDIISDSSQSESPGLRP
jgi:hypothetical protein